MGKTIKLTASDGFTFDAYEASATAKARGAVVVIQEIFGANRHIRHVADDYAARGYHAIAPALFDRAERGVELGYDQASIAAGREMRQKVKLEDTLKDLQAAIDAAGKHGKVAVVGYCWGGSLAYLAATRLTGLVCASGYYGGMVAEHAAEKIKVPTILHFGETDASIPMADVEKVRKAHPDIPVYVYAAGHGFACDERGSFDKKAADLALERTLRFFEEKLAA